MTKNLTISPWRVLLPVAIGTGLSLIGDTSLYAVLPTHTVEVGVPLASIGLLLSANRFIRLTLNSPIGWIYDHYPRRYLFVAALFIGAGSTAIYALTQGFWPLLAGRLMWGLAWAGIWVGGNAIILDVSYTHNRGRWVGLYQTSNFLGASSGAFLGGVLTDWLGYHQAMGIGAFLTLLGALNALIFLPETYQLRSMGLPQPPAPPSKSHTFQLRPPTSLDVGQNQGISPFTAVYLKSVAVRVSKSTKRLELASAITLLGANRLVLAGVLLPTLGLFLADSLGDSIQVAHVSVGVATLTGMALGMNSLIAMITAPISGRLSDHPNNRWQVVAGCLIPGIAGFSFLAFGSAELLLLSIPLIAITSGIQGLSTTLIGDLSHEQQRGRRLGLLFTTGDLTSAIGPPLAYGLIPWLGLRGIYLFSASIIGLMFLLALRWSIHPQYSPGATHPSDQ